jgi:hypothetical protein
LIKLAVTLVFVCFLQACATAENPVVDPVSMYKKGMEAGSKATVEEVRKNLKQKTAYGSVEPYDPLRLPPDVRKVWIVQHPNETGDLIQGHWIFMVVQPGRWASPLITALHPESELRMPNAIPMIEDKPPPISPGTQNKRNDFQGE